MTRQAFEAWLNPGRHAGNVSQWVKPGCYEKETHQLAWLAWQAATAAALEIAIQACEAIENDKWALYKGWPPHTMAVPGRADNYVQGESDGAGQCAEAIRALKGEA